MKLLRRVGPFLYLAPLPFWVFSAIKSGYLLLSHAAGHVSWGTFFISGAQVVILVAFAWWAHGTRQIIVQALQTAQDLINLGKNPPRRARFLILLFMPNQAGDALLGDLEERFHRIARDPELGLRYARFWYWFQVLVSLRPLAWAGVKKLTGLAALYEAIRKAVR